MPILITNTSRRPTLPSPSVITGFCVSSYSEYVSQRVEVPNVMQENIKQLTTDFKNKISTPVNALNSNIEMGEYFVIPVPELRRMLDSADNPDFIHICNALRDTPNTNGVMKTFPVSILVPVKKITEDGEDRHEVCNNQFTLYLEAYPCPPHPHCPRVNSLIQEIFNPQTVLNNFNSLL
jgi:hypothetical protein